MQNIDSLLSLPIDTLVLLAAGYLGYRLAFTGKDREHKTTDVIFISAAFAAIAKAVMMICVVVGSPAAGLFLAAPASLLVAIIWRRWVSEKVFGILKDKQIMTHDRTETAWQSLIARDGNVVRQIVVHRTDGTSYMCDDFFPFKDVAPSPLILGMDGSVVFPVSHWRDAGKEEWTEERDVVSKEWGNLLTYVPADQIKSIEMRLE
ncbi:hypothetical protein [Profundibacter sp.]